jgi:hypothetical protein
MAGQLCAAARTVELDPEYSAIAQGAGVDALVLWYERHRPRDRSLFASLEGPTDAWRQAGDGRGFCELSRLFFAKLTERYLRYFLERESTAALGRTDHAEAFRDAVADHLDHVSRHAFETSKITQSFAAGWFNAHARTGLPPDDEIRRFLAQTAGKLREELLREGAP